MILEAITFYVALPIALAMVGYAAILATQQHYKAHRKPQKQPVQLPARPTRYTVIANRPALPTVTQSKLEVSK